jgi:hypothetical protein
MLKFDPHRRRSNMGSTFRNCVVLLVLTLTLAAGAALGAAQAQSKRSPIEWGTLQGRQDAVPNKPPFVLSGADIGFRVESQKANAVVGRFVVRVNGQWLDTETGFAPKILTTGH